MRFLLRLISRAKRNGMVPQVHIIGATGRSGTALCRSLLADGPSFTPVVRNGAKWAATDIGVTARIADLDEPAHLRDALADATRIVSCAHARHAHAVLAAAPPDVRFVFLGSTRKFTNWPDAHGNGVAAGEAAFLASGRSGVMLHPTMIYGAQGEDNVQRLAVLLRRLPFVPLPDGGTALVQPIHQDDVTRAIRAALDVAWDGAAFAGDRRAVPLALRGLRSRHRRRQRAAPTAHRPAARRRADGAHRNSAVYSIPATGPSRRDPTADGRQKLRRASDDRHARDHADAPPRGPRAHVHREELNTPCRSSTASPSSIAR